MNFVGTLLRTSLTALPPITELAEWPSVKLLCSGRRLSTTRCAFDPENAATAAPAPVGCVAAGDRTGGGALPTVFPGRADELRHSERLGALNLLTLTRDVDPRHHSLRTAIAWSVDRLSPAERQAFASLEHLTTDSPLAAALAVSGSDFATLVACASKA